LNDTKNQKDDAGAKAKGFLKSLQSFESLFIIKFLIEILDRIEALNATLQKIILSSKFYRRKELMKISKTFGNLL
jgi:hypothetical protein